MSKLTTRIVFFILLNTLLTLNAAAQKKFYNLTAEEVRIDSLLPCVSHSIPLPANYKDSTYTVSLLYPEYLEMSAKEVEAYKKLKGDKATPYHPIIDTTITQSRKKPYLTASFCPIVFKDDKYQFLVSFMVEVSAKANSARAKALASDNADNTTPRYAPHSILANGKWAKIRVSETGIHQLTDEVIRKAGFSSLSKVKIFGYGGNLVPEILTDSYLRSYDDLHEVTTCTVDGKRLFYAKGSVSWASKNECIRTRNPYSNYGYYFITENDDTPLTCSDEELLKTVADSNDRYHALYEKDEFAWYHGGRNLFEGAAIKNEESRNYTLNVNEHNDIVTVTVSLTAGAQSKAQITINDTISQIVSISLLSYDKGNSETRTYSVPAKGGKVNVKITGMSSNPVRLDYISITAPEPMPLPSLASTSFPSVEYVHNITNQDLHADHDIDMVIIIPTSQNTLSQAERIKAFHEEKDNMKVRIVPADELYNEFSSGTPDASAYRRYIKMLYDKAESTQAAPKHLLLFGDCFFDNRMLTTDARSLNIDDYLLCYESENSFNEVNCFVSDDFFALLDDGESIQSGDYYRGIPDIAVGRFTCSNAVEAKVFVDKTINYAEKSPSGEWQNTLMFLGDDGNNNTHMRDVNDAANQIKSLHPGYHIRKVMWDAYTRESSSTGHRYPEVAQIIKQQQSNGALIIDYAGHGNPTSISHEAVLTLKDFTDFRNSNLPLWITASCDIMPFDSGQETIGESAMLNDKGGAIAFYGTTRTVYASYNKSINMAFLRYVLSYDETGKAQTIGEANRLTKEYLVNSGIDHSVNKMQYSLIGDPALRLALPSSAINIVIDSINGVSSENPSTQIRAGQVVRIKGHVSKESKKLTSFNGSFNALVRDTEEEIVCRLNDTSDDGAEKPFRYRDRTKVLFQGSDSIRNGEFTFLFAVPKDINYADDNGLINIYAMDTTNKEAAHCAFDNFKIGGSDINANDSIGPSIYCYLNSPDFTYGGTVNTTPYFVAEISDKDGINASGAGIGHDLQLVIDDDISKTYNLNENFQFDFGTYTSGQTYYIIPALEPGQHTLRFRAWDLLNNSSTSTLTFNVSNAIQPDILDVALSKNPVRDNTTFIINHNRIGSDISVEIDIMDASGRLLWQHNEKGRATTGTYTVPWNLSADNARSLQTGVYVYRVKLSCDGSSWASKAKKMIIIKQ